MKKKITALFLCIVMIMSFIVIHASAISPGDVDNNGRVSAADARYILRYTASLEIFTEAQRRAADLNADGKVTSADARIVLRIGASIDVIENYVKPESSTAETENKPEQTEENNTVLSPLEIYKKASEFTVEVYTYNEKGTETSIASGFYIDKNGTVITNYHVIADAYSVKVKDFTGKILTATHVEGYSRSRDLAVLRTEAENTTPAILSSKQVNIADSIYVLGSTAGFTGTFTDGIVSTSDRTLEVMNNDVKYIQITAPISNGNSGGPVLNVYGEVIGVASMSYNSAQNLNFAVPVSEISELDLSSPLTVKEFYNSDKTDAGNSFNGKIALSERGVSLEQGGTAVIYVMAAANEEYRLVCKSDSEAVRAETGKTYGNFSVIYVSAVASSGNADISVYFDGFESYAKTLTVSIGGNVTSNYVGISGSVPDFGVLTGIAPSECRDYSENNKSYYAFYYDFEKLNTAGLDRETCISDYVELMKANGFSYSATADDNTAISFNNKENGTTAFFGFSQADDGSYYMYVLTMYN